MVVEGLVLMLTDHTRLYHVGSQELRAYLKGQPTQQTQNSLLPPLSGSVFSPCPAAVIQTDQGRTAVFSSLQPPGFLTTIQAWCLSSDLFLVLVPGPAVICCLLSRCNVAALVSQRSHRSQSQRESGACTLQEPRPDCTGTPRTYLTSITAAREIITTAYFYQSFINCHLGMDHLNQF